MEFIDQLKAFDKLSMENLTPNAIAIYYHLFMVNNRCGWKEWFTESDLWMGRAVGISRRETILAAINLLKQKGFIDFKRGTGTNKPTKYKILPLFISGSNSGSNSGNPRHKTETKDNRQVNTKGAPAPKKKFVPPTLDEVNAYVMEKGLHVVAKDFWDYFDAGNWVDSKGQPVRNWKQKMLTWEKFHKKNLSTGNPQNNPQDDIAKAIAFFESQEGKA